MLARKEEKTKVALEALGERNRGAVQNIPLTFSPTLNVFSISELVLWTRSIPSHLDLVAPVHLPRPYPSATTPERRLHSVDRIHRSDQQ